MWLSSPVMYNEHLEIDESGEFESEWSLFSNISSYFGSENDESQNETNIKSRTKSEESEDRAGSGKRRNRVGIGKTKGITVSEESEVIVCSEKRRDSVGIGKTEDSTATEESKDGTGSEKSINERAPEKREDEEIYGDIIVSEDCEGKAHLNTSAVVSFASKAQCFFYR